MKKLPLVIDGEILLRSLEQKMVKTSCRILGARHGHFILIEDPLYQVNERLSTPLKGPVFCHYFNEGYLYLFNSRVLRGLGDNITLLEYPHRFEVETVRQHHRIQVKIETTFRHEGSRSSHKGIILDISNGGCQLVLSSLLVLVKDMLCQLDFTLPDGRNIENLQAKVREIRFVKLRSSTELGLQFLGPQEQLDKIAAFTQYCMFFRV